MPNKHRTVEELTFNATVGRNIKFLRNRKKLNQTKIAEALSVSFQQIQKYEKGLNGVSSIRLKQLANKFNVSMDVLADPMMITQYHGFDDEKEIEKFL